MFRVSFWLCLPALLTAPASTWAAPDLGAFFDAHCMDCHDSEMKKGGLDLAVLPREGGDEAALKLWVRVHDRVAAGEMPPAKKPRPGPEELKGFLAGLGADLTARTAARRGTVLRRLNRQEYENTVQALLGVHVPLAALLPEDGRAHGFDTVGEALAVSGVQMQRYMEAAEAALDAALSAGEKPESTVQTATLESGDRNKEHIGKHWLKREDGAVVVFNDGGFPSTVIPGLRARATGRYRVRVRGGGHQVDGPVLFALRTGSFNFRNTDTRTHSFHELPAQGLATVEVEVEMPQGHGLWISPQGLFGPDGHSAVKDGPDKYPGRGLALLSVELEGPLEEPWPPRGQTLLLGAAKPREVMPEKPWMRGKAGYKPVFTADSADPAGDARRLLPGFVSAAFRRPSGGEEVDAYVRLFEDEHAVGKDFLVAMRTAAVAVLCSPEFLFLKEPAGRLDDLALASRLAFFLTRSAPDAELLSARLTDPSVRRAQTERLLRDQAALARFVADFTDGWLNLREIEFTTPDKHLYPEYDEHLLDAMLRETRGFITELIRENLGVENLIDSRFAMLNGRLAAHYGIPGVAGTAIRRVELPAGSRRGGILTQAAVLKVSANGTNTSPVVRGVYVMDRLLGMEPPPPPPGVPGVEPDIRGATTLRELLDKHRSLESCNGCHRVIDPPGFALESYDVIGGWRDRFRSIDKGEPVNLRVDGRKVRYRLGPPVDAAGELPAGARFTGMEDFKKLLLSDQDRVARCLAEKLLTFGTGRPMGFSDRPELDRITAMSKASGHRVRDLLQAVVGSEIFLCK